MTLHYSIVVVREKGSYWSYVPDMPGVYGTGKTVALAKTDLAEALKLYIEDCRADGDPLWRPAQGFAPPNSKGRRFQPGRVLKRVKIKQRVAHSLG